MKSSAISDLRMVLLMQALKSRSLMEAIGLMEGTWHFAARYAPDGRLSADHCKLLAAFLHYPAEDGILLFSMLVDAGWAIWVDGSEDAVVLADWDRYQPVAQQARNRMRRARRNHQEPPVEERGARNRGASVAQPARNQEAVSGENVVPVAQQRHKGEEGGGGGVGVSNGRAGTKNPPGSEETPPKAKPSGKYPVMEDVLIPDSLDTPEVYQALAMWLDNRRALHRGITLKGVHLLLKRYVGRPADFVRDVEYSVSNGWQGVFSPDEKDGAPTPKNWRGERPLLSPTNWSTHHEPEEALEYDSV